MGHFLNLVFLRQMDETIIESSGEQIETFKLMYLVVPTDSTS
jgi:hypothetical protein